MINFFRVITLLVLLWEVISGHIDPTHFFAYSTIIQLMDKIELSNKRESNEDDTQDK